MDLASCLAFTFKEEGVWSDNASDPGRATCYGITIATLSAWRGVKCSVDDVHELTTKEASAIYGANYWNAVRGGSLPAGVDLMVFDHAVNAGVSGSAKIVQRLVHTAQDGHIGPITMHAILGTDVIRLLGQLHTAQHDFYASSSLFPIFGQGWLARLERRFATAAKMINTNSGT